MTALSAGRLALVRATAPAPPLTALLGAGRAGAVSGEGRKEGEGGGGEEREGEGMRGERR